MNSVGISEAIFASPCVLFSNDIHIQSIICSSILQVGRNLGGYLGVSIDSRTIKPGYLFVSLSDTSTQNSRFILDAIQNGACGIITAFPIIPDESVSIHRVESTLNALQALAGYVRTHSHARCVAITGSVGKTTVKEMLLSIMRKVSPVIASYSSYNNQTGVPLSVLNLTAEHHFGIFEVGMNHPGEIAPLSRLIKPELCIITTIAPAHLAAFDSIHDIAREKLSVVSGMSNTGAILLNADLPFTPFLIDTLHTLGFHEIYTVGRSNLASVQLKEWIQTPEGSMVTAIIFGRLVSYSLKLIGDHFVYNSLLAITASLMLGVELSIALKEIGQFEPIPGRGNRHTIKWHGHDITIIDDAYNANPLSMQTSLDTFHLTSTVGRKIVILGAMLELGNQSPEFHTELARRVNEYPFECVLTLGEHMAPFAPIFTESHSLYSHHHTLEELESALLTLIQTGDTLFFKASKGTRLRHLVQKILTESA